MKKECCDVKVSELENGYTVEITGDDVKEKCKDIFDNCCSGKNLKKIFQECCGSKE